MQNKLAKPDQNNQLSTFDPDLDFFIKWLCPGASQDEARMYGMQCQAMGLDPRKNQCYFIVSGKGQNKKFNLYTSSQQVRMLVLQSKKLEYEEGPFWAELPEPGEEPVWQKYWSGRTPKGQTTIPALCMIRTKRTDMDLVFETVRYFREVKQVFKDTGDLSGNWATRPLECFERVTRRKCYNDNFFDVVAGVGVYEDMADDIREFAEDGTEVQVIDLTGDIDLHDRFNTLGWSDEKREEFLQKYGDNKAAALHKLDQHVAAAGIPSEQAENSPTREPESTSTEEKKPNSDESGSWRDEQQPDSTKLDLDGE